MSKKTKAEKIVASLRAQRFALQASSEVTPTVGTMTTSPAKVLSALHEPQTHFTQDTDVYEPKDLRKTIIVTLFVVALLILVYVFQYKGYF